MIGWFREGDEAHRNVAWSCLCFDRLLGPDECRALLREAWDDGGRDDDDRTMLAVGLLGLGDRVGWAFLVEFARRADRYSACWAAETILEHDPALGLDLMIHILDHGTMFRVRWGWPRRSPRPPVCPTSGRRTVWPRHAAGSSSRDRNSRRGARCPVWLRYRPLRH